MDGEDERVAAEDKRVARPLICPVLVFVVPSLLSCCSLMHKLHFSSFSWQLINFFQYSQKGAAGDWILGSSESDRARR